MCVQFFANIIKLNGFIRKLKFLRTIFCTTFLNESINFSYFFNLLFIPPRALLLLSFDYRISIHWHKLAWILSSYPFFHIYLLLKNYFNVNFSSQLSFPFFYWILSFSIFHFRLPSSMSKNNAGWRLGYYFPPYLFFLENLEKGFFNNMWNDRHFDGKCRHRVYWKRMTDI